MDTFIISLSVITGLWLITIAVWMSTENFISMLLFKAIPGTLGALWLIHAGKLLGWL